jgi:hypothetical protein
MVFGAAGAAQTLNLEDCRPAQKPCLKNPRVHYRKGRPRKPGPGTGSTIQQLEVPAYPRSSTGALIAAEASGRSRAIDVAKPYEIIGLGAIDVAKPYEFKGFGAINVTKPYKSIGFGAIDVTKPYKFIWFYLSPLYFSFLM